MKLVDEWRKCWKWLSMYGIAALGFTPVVYENISFVQDFVSPTLFHNLMGVLGALTLLARLVKQ